MIGVLAQNVVGPEGVIVAVGALFTTEIGLDCADKQNSPVGTIASV